MELAGEVIGCLRNFSIERTAFTSNNINLIHSSSAEGLKRFRSKFTKKLIDLLSKLTIGPRITINTIGLLKSLNNNSISSNFDFN